MFPQLYRLKMESDTDGESLAWGIPRWERESLLSAMSERRLSLRGANTAGEKRKCLHFHFKPQAFPGRRGEKSVGAPIQRKTRPAPPPSEFPRIKNKASLFFKKIQ